MRILKISFQTLILTQLNLFCILLFKQVIQEFKILYDLLASELTEAVVFMIKSRIKMN